MTINEAMVYQKALRGRYAELSRLRSESSTREIWRDPNKVIEPVYDIKVIDKKCVELENALFEIDAAIKQSNALTRIETSFDVKALMEPLQ